MEDRLLITTSDERSWPDITEKVLFLGTWCTKINRKHIWSKYDFKVVKPLGISMQQKKNDREFISSIIEQITVDVARELNVLHSTDHSLRYWNIIIGNWLLQYIKVILNRYRLIEYVVSKNLANRTIKIETSDFSFNDVDAISFTYRLNEDYWNHNLYIELLKYFPNNDIKIIEKYFDRTLLTSKKRKHKTYKHYIKKLLSFSRFFTRDTDAILVDTFLPTKENLKLYFFLGQFPVCHNFYIDYCKLNSVETSKRDSFFRATNGHNGVELAIRGTINKVIPHCYIEGYESICKKLKTLRLPNKPRFIFTSNAFEFNEYFKFWTAGKVESGVPYFVGQHGSNYGTLKGSEDWSEIKTCDIFYSWGWNEIYQKKTVSSFNFKVASQRQHFNPNGIGLLVERGPGNANVTHDKFYDHSLYQKYVFKFYKKLDSNIKNRITVRLHHGSSYFESSDLLLWNKEYPNANIDNFSVSLSKLIKKSRLVIFSYECSGFLECMAYNIPTICFFRNGVDHLFDDAKSYYQMLENAGIFTNNAEKAASIVNKNWEDVSKWWFSKITQDARRKFCERYSRVIKKPIKNLAQKFLEDSKIS